MFHFFRFFRCAHSAKSNWVFRCVSNGLTQVHDQSDHLKCNLVKVKYANTFSESEEKKNYMKRHLANKNRCSTAGLSEKTIWHPKLFLKNRHRERHLGFCAKFRTPSWLLCSIEGQTGTSRCFLSTFFVWDIYFFLIWSHKEWRDQLTWLQSATFSRYRLYARFPQKTRRSTMACSDMVSPLEREIWNK